MNTEQAAQIVEYLECLLHDEALNIAAQNPMSERLVLGILQKWSPEVRGRVLSSAGYPFNEDQMARGHGENSARGSEVITVMETSRAENTPVSNAVPELASLDLNLEADQSSAGITKEDNMSPVHMPTMKASMRTDIESLAQVPRQTITTTTEKSQVTGKEKKRMGEVDLGEASSNPKRTRLALLDGELSKDILTQMRIKHSEGSYHQLEEKELLVSPSWSSNQRFHLLQLKKPVLKVLEQLMDDLLNPESLMEAMRLMVAMSKRNLHKSPYESAGNSLIPFSSQQEGVTEPRPSMPVLIEVARRAHNYVTTYESSPYEARLRLILSYITLHLTLEYGLAPRIEKENPKFTKKQIKGRKWEVFFEELGGEEGLGCKLQTLKDNVGYGKVFWKWIQDCGMIWLPVFAVLDRGLTTFVKQNPVRTYHSEVIGSKLSTQESWLGFAKSFTPLLVKLNFHNDNKIYSLKNLTELYIMELKDPYASASLLDTLEVQGYSEILFSDQNDLLQPPASLKPSGGTIFDLLQIELPMLPKNEYALQDSMKINLVKWVLNAKHNQSIEIACRSEFDVPSIILHVQDLASLFSPIGILTHVFSFFCRLWDRLAITGWLCLTLEEGEFLLFKSLEEDFIDGLQKLYKTESTFDMVKHIVIPYQTEATYFILVCVPTEMKTIAYAWNCGIENANEVKKMLNALLSSSILHNWELAVKVEDPSSMGETFTRHEIGLFALLMLRFIVTRTQFCLEYDQIGKEQAINRIVHTCLTAAYRETILDEHCILPDSL